jgi:hypothetical protein
VLVNNQRTICNVEIKKFLIQKSNVMAKIVISDLRSIDVEIFLHGLAPVQLETIFGGASDIYISNVPDSVIDQLSDVTSKLSTLIPSLNLDNNKFLTVDFSKLNINFVFAS